MSIRIKRKKKKSQSYLAPRRSNAKPPAARSGVLLQHPEGPQASLQLQRTFGEQSSGHVCKGNPPLSSRPSCFHWKQQNDTAKLHVNPPAQTLKGTWVPEQQELSP